MFGNSVEVLPTLSWDMRTIIWLDYDGTLTKDVLADIQFVLSNLSMGSMFIVSVNAEPEKEENVARGVELLHRRLGENVVPIDVTNADLRKWGAAAIYKRIVNNQIQEALSNKNGGRRSGNKVLYQQLFNFNYADGMKMLTTGGIIFDEGQQRVFPLEDIRRTHSFVRFDDEAYIIRVPNLTYRELRYLDGLLPDNKSHVDVQLNIPPQDVENYAEIYRYFPTFAETDV